MRRRRRSAVRGLTAISLSGLAVVVPVAGLLPAEERHHHVEAPNFAWEAPPGRANTFTVGTATYNVTWM